MTIFLSQKLCCATYLDQFWLKLGPIVDSKNLTSLGHVWPFRDMLKHFFIVFLARICIFKPTPKNSIRNPPGGTFVVDFRLRNACETRVFVVLPKKTLRFWGFGCAYSGLSHTPKTNACQLRKIYPSILLSYRSWGLLIGLKSAAELRKSYEKKIGLDKKLQSRLGKFILNLSCYPNGFGDFLIG